MCRKTIRDSFRRIVSQDLRFDDRGASAIEYALWAGILAIGLIGTLTLTRQSVQVQYDCAAMRLDSAGAHVCANSGTVTPTSPLTAEARRAQALLDPGDQIIAGGLFYDRLGGTSYSILITAVANPLFRSVILRNSGSDQSVALSMPASSNDVYQLDRSLLSSIGPGPAETETILGAKGVLFAVPDTSGTHRLYYGTTPL